MRQPPFYIFVVQSRDPHAQEKQKLILCPRQLWISQFRGDCVAIWVAPASNAIALGGRIRAVRSGL